MTRKKPGPGHPVTTGMAKARPVHYRVTKAQRDELDAEAKRTGVSSGDLVAKLRAFPAHSPGGRRA